MSIAPRLHERRGRQLDRVRSAYPLKQFDKDTLSIGASPVKEEEDLLPTIAAQAVATCSLEERDQILVPAKYLVQEPSPGRARKLCGADLGNLGEVVNLASSNPSSP